MTQPEARALLPRYTELDHLIDRARAACAAGDTDLALRLAGGNSR